MAADIKLNIDRVVGNLERIARDFAYEDIGSALYAEAEAIKTRSMQLTPVDTGALRASHTVSLPKIEDDGVSVTIGVGGTAAPYSVYVHEDLTKHHNVGQAKFLATAISERTRTMAARIANALRRKFTS